MYKPQTNEISILEVEAVQLVTCLFRVHDIFVNYERGTFGAVGYTLPYLPASSFSCVPKTICFQCDQDDVRCTDVPYRPKFSKEIEEFFRRYIIAAIRS